MAADCDGAGKAVGRAPQNSAGALSRAAIALRPPYCEGSDVWRLWWCDQLRGRPEAPLSPLIFNTFEGFQHEGWQHEYKPEPALRAQVDADLWGTAKFVDSVRLPYIAPSLGGVDSLIEQPTVISYWDQVMQPPISRLSLRQMSQKLA